MKRWLAFFLLAVILLPGSALSTGSLTTPNVIFTTPNPVPTSKLDQNWNAHSAYINAREITFGLLSARPSAGTAGRYYFGTDTQILYADTGTAWTQLAPAANSPAANVRASLTLANSTGSTQFFSVFPGAASSDDSTIADRALITLTSTYTKKLTSWAVGTGLGCLDAGSAAVFTWYHIFIITRVDTGVVDILCSTSATSPTMPSNYTKKQRLGAIRTTWFATAGNEIYQFRQVKNKFRWATMTAVTDVVNNTPGAGTTVIATLSVPNGVVTEAIVICATANTGAVYISELNVTDEAASAGGNPSTCMGPGATNASQAVVMADTAQRIRYQNVANVGVVIATLGYYEMWD